LEEETKREDLKKKDEGKWNMRYLHPWDAAFICERAASIIEELLGYAPQIQNHQLPCLRPT
jgi:hypothetical protein